MSGGYTSVKNQKNLSTELRKTAIKAIKTTKEPKELNARLSKFAMLIKELMDRVPLVPENQTMLAQLSKNVASLSVDYNIDFATRSKTNSERKADILLRHIREVDCWIRFIKRNNSEFKISDLDILIKECVEIKNILAAIAE